MPAITRSARYHLVVFGVAVLAGLLMGNFAYLVVGLVVLGFLLLGVRSGLPRDVAVARTMSVARTTAGSIVHVQVEVTVRAGRGFVQVHDRLPDAFSLVDGNNTHFLFKGDRPRRFVYAYSFRCTRRGEYVFSATRVLAIHALGLLEALEVGRGEDLTLRVDPRVLHVRRVKELRGKAVTLFPAGDVAKTGTRTTDFLELRDYQAGDPLRSVNWRATAKQSPGDDLRLMVNEYDVEGKKSVWFLIDAGEHMEVGSTLENTFDQTIEAALELIRHFVDHGYRIGGAVFNTSAPGHDAPLFYTDHGRAHFLKIARTLSGLATAPARDGLPAAVERSRGFLAREKPLVLLVTRPEADFEGTVSGVKRLLAHVKTARRKHPILLIAPRVQSAARDSQRVSDVALALVEKELRLQHQVLRRMGVSLLDWDPKRGPIGAVMARRGRMR